jgi:hypothetical protein
MNKRVKEAIICVLMMVLVVAIYRSMCMVSCIKQLVNSGWVLLSNTQCHFCTLQKHILGGKYPITFECDGGLPDFVKGRIKAAFPTWYNTQTGETKVGVQEKRELQKMADAVTPAVTQVTQVTQVTPAVTPA